jgi:hypothetical protein
LGDLAIWNLCEVARRTIAVCIVDNKLLYLRSLNQTDYQGAVLTLALAQSNRPPMGAKMTATAKKIGSTVFGVRIGCHAFSRC